MAFLTAPEVCKVEELFPLSIDREFWSLAALKGGAGQLGFPGAAAAIRAGVASCTAAGVAAAGAYAAALRAAGSECSAAPRAAASTATGASPSGSCGAGGAAARQAVLALAERWRATAGPTAHAAWAASAWRRAPAAAGFAAPLGNETSSVLAEYAVRLREALGTAEIAAEGLVADPQGAAERPGLASYRLLTDLALELARLARQLMENLRLAWALRNLVGELAPMYPDILGRLPPVAYHTEVYGRHWDVLEQLLLTLRAEQEARGHEELRMAEMGVACGPIGFHLCLRFPELVYHGADPTIGPKVFEAYRRFGSRATLHAVTSEKLHNSLPEDYPFDLVFIDGPHTYQNVRRDIELWQPRVRPGGILAGHDFTCAHPPLLWAVLESRLHGGGDEVHVGADGVWWWRVT